MSETNRNSYGNILKSIGLFGGTKLIQILIGLIRNKIIAVLLGPIGMGISGMITSTTGLISAFTGMGLHTSSVRDIAMATESGNQERVSIVISVLRKLVNITGLLGMAVTFVLAPYLSKISFGNSDYTLAFRIVSIALLFDQLCVGQTVLMQGTFHYKYMAKASICGCLLGLVLSIPLYFIYGNNAIVPAIIVTSLCNLIFAWLYSKKIQLKKTICTKEILLHYGKTMIILGFAIALTGVLNTGQTYVFRAFLTNNGGVSEVGLYTAGIAIATQYVNVLLQSMGADYSPRLSAVSDNNELFTETVNRQLRLMITLVTPLIILFVVFIKPITIILYSDSFTPVSRMIEWMMVGMFFRAWSWCLSFTIISKGQSKTFFWNELACLSYYLLLSIAGYLLYGFTGIGVAFVINYILYTIQLYIVCGRMFHYKTSKETIMTIIVNLLVLIVSFLLLQLIGYSYLRFIFGICLFISSLLVSLKFLNEMIPLQSIINKIRLKYGEN